MKLIQVYESISNIIENLHNGEITGEQAQKGLEVLKNKAFAAGLVIEVPPLSDLNLSENTYNSSQVDAYLSS